MPMQQCSENRVSFQKTKAKIVDGLNGILSDIESGKLEITDEYEDIHTFMEATLIERIGDTGKSCTPEEAVTTRLHWICAFIHVMRS